MASVPGSAGLPIVGDKSYDFYKDPVGFVDGHIQRHGSRIFLSRVLNKSCVFIGSNDGVRELLTEHGSCLELGYKSIMHDIYGDNILFAEGDAACNIRQILLQVLSHESFINFQEIVDRCVQRSLLQLDCSQPICAYEFFKKITTEMSLSLFLDLDFDTSSELAEEITHLTTMHWHGIISVPVNLQLPFATSSSSIFGKALQAKAKLIEIINKKLASAAPNTFPKLMDNNFQSANQATNNMLVFTSALIPKALASILTSYVVATADKDDLISESLDNSLVVDHILLEVQRLWPPFIAGRRLVRKDCEVEGMKLHKGQAAIYVTHAAHRDPKVFHNPNCFDPSRWKNGNINDQDKLYCFGGGSRCCIGQRFVGDILKRIVSQFSKQYSWVMLNPDKEIVYKWLPVARPRDNAMIKLTKRVSVEKCENLPDS